MPECQGAAENGDQFGYSVALSPRVGSRAATLAVGAPGENAGTVVDTGSVTLFNNAERAVRVAGLVQPGDRWSAGDQRGRRPVRLLPGLRAPGADGCSSDRRPRMSVLEANAGTVQPVRIPGASSPLQFLPTITETTVGMGEQRGHRPPVRQDARSPERDGPRTS